MRIPSGMHFIDEITIEVRAGNGGNGSHAMRREKYIPFGGPAGGDGGRGADIIFVADTRLSTLMDLHFRRLLKAEHGEHGRGKDQYGKGGKDMVVEVPVGTQVFDHETGEVLFDFKAVGERFVIAKGGRGGRGNLHFVTSSDQAPMRAEKGEPGEIRKLRLELKLLADVGLLGFPNVGKSTFIAAVSRARPKIADYPFTTLAPNLGMVSLGDGRNFVVADVPGIIEGAAEGAGLGHRFLKHIERTRVLLHIITLDPDPERDPVRDFEVLNEELRKFDPRLAERPQIVGISKTDLPDVKETVTKVKRALKRRGIDNVFAFSAATGDGVEKVLLALEQLLKEHPILHEPRAIPLAPRKRGQVDADEGVEVVTDE